MEVWQARVAEGCAWGWRTSEVLWTKQTAVSWLPVAPRSLPACFDPPGRTPSLSREARGGEGTTFREGQVVGTFLRSRDNAPRCWSPRTALVGEQGVSVPPPWGLCWRKWGDRGSAQSWLIVGHYWAGWQCLLCAPLPPCALTCLSPRRIQSLRRGAWARPL